MTVKKPVCILGYDALEIELVEKFGLPNLKQKEYSKTDISEFEKTITPILWGSFITGKNMEPDWDEREDSDFLKRVLRDPFHFVQRNISPKLSNFLRRFAERMGVLKSARERTFRYNYLRDRDEKTIFDYAEDSIAINIPSYNKQRNPKFGTKDKIEGKISDEEYWDDIWECFDKTKRDLLDNLDKDLVMAWFWAPDRAGHVWRPDIEKMRKTYQILDEFAGEVRENFDGQVFVIADHGMETLGKFGDHSNYGYYSSNRELGLKNPKITDFYNIIEDVIQGEFDPQKYEKGQIEERGKEEFKGNDEKEIKKRLKDLGYFD